MPSVEQTPEIPSGLLRVYLTSASTIHLCARLCLCFFVVNSYVLSAADTGTRIGKMHGRYLIQLWNTLEFQTKYHGLWHVCVLVKLVKYRGRKLIKDEDIIYDRSEQSLLSLSYFPFFFASLLLAFTLLVVSLKSWTHCCD